MKQEANTRLDTGPPGGPSETDPRETALVHMRRALELAEAGLGHTAPNPPVGCVIVQGDQVVGEGFHPRAGEPHAEVFALRAAGERARDATAFVTLEPCSHHGRTPPCADALIGAGIARVVVAATDPNPQVSGRGLARLRAAGITVETGVLRHEAERQQAGFRSAMLRGRAHVIYKYAMTLDGKVAAGSPGQGESNGAVSGAAARALTMRWRSQSDAIAIGSGTLLTDDPQLNTRGLADGRDPRPVIFDRSGRTPPQARAVREGTVVVTAPGTDLGEVEARGATILRAADLGDALVQLCHLDIHTVLLEGGPTVAGAFAAAGLIDELRVFVAPKLLGAGLPPLLSPTRAMAHADPFTFTDLQWVGDDLLLRAERAHDEER